MIPVFIGKGRIIMSKLNDFLTASGVFFLATCDGDQPKLRPLGAHMEADGKVIFGVGDFKKVYKQMLANPKVEISALRSDGKWLRYTGKAVFETDPKYAEMMLDGAPELRNIYNDQTGFKMKCFHLEDAEGYEMTVMGVGENILE